MAQKSYHHDRIKLCALLVQAREEAKYTQKQVAETGIVSQSEISKIENGQRKVEFIVLLDLPNCITRMLVFLFQIMLPKGMKLNNLE